jgi:hypothetical protein
MKAKIYLVLILAFFSLQFAAAKPHEVDTVKRDHLIVKLNLLWSVVYIGSPNNGYLLSLPLEYRTKSAIGFQLTTTYDHGLIVDEGDAALKVIPEIRYYFKNHFTGIYTKYEAIDRTRFLHSDRLAEWTEKNTAIGAFYGYQWVFNRLIVEGQAGAGIIFNLDNSARSMNYPYPTINKDPSVDVLLAIHVGWRIF